MDKPIRVGIVCGWFASGKTTVIRSLLQSLRAQPQTNSAPRLAVIHNCVSSVVADKYVTETDTLGYGNAKVYEVGGGCACCAGRNNLRAALQNIVKTRQSDYVLIEAPAQAHPQSIAACVEEVKPLQMDAIIAVLDAGSFLMEYGLGKEDPRRLEMLNSQLAAAQVVIVNRKDGGGEGPRLDSALPIILRSLSNPSPSIVHTQTGQVPSEVLLNTSLYRSGASSKGFVPESRERYTAFFIYESDQAFHPDRLYRLLTSGTSHLRATRAKGRFHLASRPDRAGLWSYPAPVDGGGAGTAVEGGMRWGSSTVNAGFSSGGSLKKTALVFMDAGADRCANETAIRRLLDACLIKDSESSPYGPDRFPLWGSLPSPAESASSVLDRDSTSTQKHQHQRTPSHTTGHQNSLNTSSTTATQSSGRILASCSVSADEVAVFVASLKDQTGTLAQECENLLELVSRSTNSPDRRGAPLLPDLAPDGSIIESGEEDEESDPLAVAALKSCVLVTTRVVESVALPFIKLASMRKALSADKEVQFRNAATEIRESAVSFVRACREAINNPMDFMANQKAKSQLARVKSAINNLLSLAYAFQVHQSAPATSRPSQLAVPGGGVTEQDQRVKEEVIKLVEQAAEGLRDVGAAVESRNTALFVGNTKALIIHCTALIDAANAHPPVDQDAFQQEKERLEDVMLGFVTHGRKLFTSHEQDQGLEEIWEDSKRELARSIKVVSLAVLTALQRDEELARGLPYSPSPSRLSTAPPPPLVDTSSIADLDMIIKGQNPARTAARASLAFTSVPQNLGLERGDRNSTPDPRSRGRGGAWTAGSLTPGVSRPPIPARSAKPSRNLSPPIPRGYSSEGKSSVSVPSAILSLDLSRTPHTPQQPQNLHNHEHPKQATQDWNMTLRNKDKGATDTRELKQALHAYAEWRKITQQRNAHKKPLDSLSETTPEEEQFETITAIFSDVVVNFVISASEYALGASDNSATAPSYDVILAEASNQVLVLLKGVARLCTAASGRCQGATPVMRKIADAVTNQLNAAPMKGKSDKHVLTAAETPHFTATVIRMAQQRITSKSTDILNLSAQALSMLKSDTFMKGTLGSTVQYLISLVATMLADISALLDLTETVKSLYIRSDQEKRSKRGSTYGISAEALLDNLQDDVSVWDEGDEDSSNLRRGLPPAPKDTSAQGSAPAPPAKPVVLAGSLNKLVECLTTDKEIDPSFMNTFITTYQSFTSSWKLFEKLQQRYQVPNDKEIDKTRQQSIQMRVVVVLKHWVENQFQDFDEELVARIVEFIEETIKNEQPHLHSRLSGELSNRMAARTKVLKALYIQPIDVVAPSVSSLYQLFSKFKPLEIAQQLTLAEWENYSRIEVEPLSFLTSLLTSVHFSLPSCSSSHGTRIHFSIIRQTFFA
eukprot:TRINITY_DN5869_c1_g1_i6.p1 TRINITY_DN5869_c1_g1~~TRINITY_DN5869_c1_g1_i6.p1  ORF type:complete len:1406 (+),score=195.77 TRINITY_DN5869_c1_g1_i6:268-4485(+)